MKTQYQAFFQTLTSHPQHLIEFYLPTGVQIPKHFHVTDVGSVFRYFIDCGAQVRDEAYVQIQLWLGKDTEHRLSGETVSKILTHSQVVLDKLPDLQNTDVQFEYKDQLITQYGIAKMQVKRSTIEVHLASLSTQCLAANRHEAEMLASESELTSKQKATNSCCSPGCCS